MFVAIRMQKHDWEDRNPSKVYSFHGQRQSKSNSKLVTQKTEEDHKKNNLPSYNSHVSQKNFIVCLYL